MAKLTLDDVENLGFDNSRLMPFKGVTVGCSQCQAVCVNGTPCHETGCPNERHECFECDTLVPKGVRLCDDCFDELQRDYDAGFLPDDEDDF